MKITSFHVAFLRFLGFCPKTAWR